MQVILLIYSHFYQILSKIIFLYLEKFHEGSSDVLAMFRGKVT